MDLILCKFETNKEHRFNFLQTKNGKKHEINFLQAKRTKKTCILVTRKTYKINLRFFFKPTKKSLKKPEI